MRPPPTLTSIVLFVLSLAVLNGCAGSSGSARGSSSSRAGSNGGAQTGVASYYADKYHGRTTASGERFDTNKLTAAHRTLPFGTRVRVTNLDNGKQVIVKVNDRGPFVKGRIIDLSRAAAKRVDMIRAGLAKVKVEVLDAPAAASARG
jgi:rare lipoprotein A